MTLAIVIAAAVIAQGFLLMGFARFGFEVGCRYQASHDRPEIAHDYRSFKEALAWARNDRWFRRYKPGMFTLMFTK